MLCILHAQITGGDHPIQDSIIGLESGKIAFVRSYSKENIPSYAKIFDAAGLVASAGWIDIQINGGFGYDFTQNPASIWEVGARLARYGTTSFLPTIITSPYENIAAAQQALLDGPPAGWRGAVPLGLHLEGPFLNPGKKGAHNPAYLRLPDRSAVKDWTLEKGVRLVTLAPELPGALELAGELKRRGILVSAGHSLATYDQALQAFEMGISFGTHLFNAMPTLEHRAPGLTAALLTTPGIGFGLIADGVHCHPAMLRVAWECKGGRGLVLVTDAVAALGMPDGVYNLASQQLHVSNGSVRLADGTLAGSTLTLDRAIQNLMAASGCKLDEALACLTCEPADRLGLKQKGRLTAGADADLTLISPEGKVEIVFVGGKVAYSSQDSGGRE